MTTAREIMTEAVDFVESSTTVADVAAKLASGGYGSLPVYDGDRLVAMVTDRDIVVKVVAKGRDCATTTVGDLGPMDVVTIGADDSVEQAMRAMSEHQIRRLPVLDGDKLVGIISQADVARHGNDSAVGNTVQAISQ